MNDLTLNIVTTDKERREQCTRQVSKVNCHSNLERVQILPAGLKLEVIPGVSRYPAPGTPTQVFHHY